MAPRLRDSFILTKPRVMFQVLGKSHHLPGGHRGYLFCLDLSLGPIVSMLISVSGLDGIPSNLPKTLPLPCVLAG